MPWAMSLASQLGLVPVLLEVVMAAKPALVMDPVPVALHLVRLLA
jgi:hypothetical protein